MGRISRKPMFCMIRLTFRISPATLISRKPMFCMIRLTSLAGPGVLGKPYLNVLHDSAYFWISPDGSDRSDFDILLF